MRASLAPVSVPLPSLPNRRWARLPICLWLAALLHVGALLVHAPARPSALRSAAWAVPEGIPISFDSLPRWTDSIPGGGSEEPDTKGEGRRLPDGPQQTAPKAVRVEPVPIDPELTGVAERVFDQADGVPFVRPRRTQTLAERSVPEPTSPSNQPPSNSRWVGYGPGANGGPGGPGRGWGRGKNVVNGQFAFGGTSGAFRGDVCFFEPRVRGLGEIKDCRPAATFYTSVLNVPPRRFTQGFPGVSSRIEWFAIRYRGKIRVSTAGTYKFRLLSDDGAMLYIDGRCIVNNDGQHPPTSRVGSLALTEGEHDFFLDYYQGPRESIALQLFVTPENGGERLLGPNL